MLSLFIETRSCAENIFARLAHDFLNPWRQVLLELLTLMRTDVGRRCAESNFLHQTKHETTWRMEIQFP